MSDSDDRRARQLVEAIGRDIAGGRLQEAERNLRQAVAQAPNHPLVLNEVARRKLQTGDWAGAHDLLLRVVKEESSNPAIWLNLAASLHGLKREDEELAALNEVLALQPGNLQALFQVGAIHGARGDLRTAAAIYRTALQTIPATAELSPAMRQAMQTARAAIDANNLALETFLEDRLKPLRSQHADEPLGRFDKALDTLLFKRRIYRPQPSFLYYPQLPAIEFYERADFPWLDSIEAATDDIREELLNVLAEDADKMRPYVNFPPEAVADKWRDLNRSLRWGVYYLWIEGEARPDNMARCPRTMAALEAWPRCDLPACAPTAMFSILEAGAHIPAHAGSNNARLVVHLPLIVPPDCTFRVGAETRAWEEGKAFIFDDTIEHEAWNRSDQWRGVLILDIWNPLLSEAERDMVRALTAGLDDYYRDMPDFVARVHRPG